MSRFLTSCSLYQATHVLHNPVNVVNKVPASEGIEDSRTLDTAILRKVQIVANLLDNFSLIQNMVVVRVVFQTVDIRFYFHNRLTSVTHDWPYVFR